jgi:hypothetical protein
MWVRRWGKSRFYPHSTWVDIHGIDCSHNEASYERLASRKHTRVSPPPGDLLAMSHVLDENVAPENRGGRRKFAETEGIVLMKEIVANDTHCVPAWQGD